MWGAVALLAGVIWFSNWLEASVPPLPDEPMAVVPLEIRTGGGEAHRLDVELARTPAQRRRGLMEREHLADDAGMLFLYPEEQAAHHGFWMFRTRIPLDIAFLDDAGRILVIHTMQPCASEIPRDCPVTLPGVSYHAALEVNAGYFAGRGLAPGDRIVWANPVR